MRKRCLIAFLCLTICFVTSMPIYANFTIADNEKGTVIIPTWEFIHSARCTISNYQGRALITCNVNGNSGITTKISITADLQRYQNGHWSRISSFSKTTYSHNLFLSEPVSVASGYTYRVVARIHAYSGSAVETRTITSNQVKF